MPISWVSPAVLVLFLISSASGLIRDVEVAAARGLHGAPVGDFEHFVLSTSWTNEFCCGSSSPQCDVLPDSFASRNLALHGLWPNYSAERTESTGYGYPMYCGNCPNDQSCPVDQDVKDRFFDEWRMWAPGYSDDTLDDHEWAKHGSCTGWSQARYFEEGLELMRKDRTADAIRLNLGESVSVAEIQRAYGGPEWVGLACATSSYSPLPVLTDVFLCYRHVNNNVGPRVPCNETDILNEPYTNGCVTNEHQMVFINEEGECPLLNPDCPQGEDQHGCCRTVCSTHSDCADLPCLRCANSGRCTGVPLEDSDSPQWQY